MTLDKADMMSLGRAKKATVTKEDTILLDGAGSKDTIEERNEQLRQAINASTSDYDRCTSYPPTAFCASHQAHTRQMRCSKH